VSQFVRFVDKIARSDFEQLCWPLRGGGQEARNKSIAIAMVTDESDKMAAEIFPKTV
jgi:hypothetical protein